MKRYFLSLLFLNSYLLAAPTVGAWVELRPTYLSNVGEFHGENEVALAMRPQDGLLFAYVQEFRNNFHNPASDSPNALDLTLGDGYLKSEVLRFYASPSESYSLDHEGRLYVPTLGESRNNGFLAAARNYFKLNVPLTGPVSLGVWEIPIVYGFAKPGGTVNGELTANPIFENQVQVMANISVLRNRLNIKVPLIHQWTRYRAFDESAKFDNRWVHTLKFYPEALLNVAENTVVGLAFTTDTLVNDDFSEFRIGDGFSKMGFQVVLNQSL